jgi:hypothetical protein
MGPYRQAIYAKEDRRFCNHGNLDFKKPREATQQEATTFTTTIVNYKLLRNATQNSISLLWYLGA